MMYKVDESLIERINSDNNILWYAKKYEQFEKMTVAQMNSLMGQKPRRRYGATFLLFDFPLGFYNYVMIYNFIFYSYFGFFNSF